MVDLGDFMTTGKADVVSVQVPFEIGPSDGMAPGRLDLSFRTLGTLALQTAQSPSRERLQLVAETTGYRRRSARGRAPRLVVPGGPRQGTLTPYVVQMLNYGTSPARGMLTVQTEAPPEPVIDVLFNQPDCLGGCEDRSGGMRGKIVDAIQRAKVSIDLAIYGFDDPSVKDALCEAQRSGVRVRVVADDEVADAPEGGEEGRYHDALLHPETGLVACGIPVTIVRSAGIMHDKFYLIDREGDAPLLVTGSTNQTVADFDQNHNHMVYVPSARALMDVYQGEFDQLFRRCATERIDPRGGRCTECTPACTEDRSTEDPFTVGDATVRALFSPTDDVLGLVRGAVVERKVPTPDPACNAQDATCVCRLSGRAWSCSYCAQGPDGFGLIGSATSRVLLDIYSATDDCLALGMLRAHQRGVRTVGVWDFVKAGSPYSRDDYLAAEGVETWVTRWGGGSAQVRNHHKTLVVDDTVVDGSMNLSASGATVNDENTLVIQSRTLADTFDRFIASEVTLMAAQGLSASNAATSRCKDLVDNDGDGLADASDLDCDTLAAAQ